jgi:hypothetical protein
MTVVYKFKNKFYESFNLAMQDFITFVIEQCMGYETENEISFEDRNSSLEHDEMMFYGAWYTDDCPLQQLYELGMILVKKFTYNNPKDTKYYSIKQIKLTDNPTVCLFNLTDKEKYVEYFKTHSSV